MTFASPACRALLLAALSALAVAASGCTPKIGSKCTLSTDCSQTGARVCDTAPPGGYCTVLNCTNGSCPDEAVCVLFQSAVPGCAYDDYQAPARTGRSFCMAHCSKNSDCRESDGYECADPTGAPWHASILDNNSSQGVCIPVAGLLADAGSDFGAEVCTPTTYDADTFAEVDATASEEIDAGSDAEGGPEADSVAPEDSPSDAPPGD
jgi:hypothetical protein